MAKKLTKASPKTGVTKYATAGFNMSGTSQTYAPGDPYGKARAEAIALAKKAQAAQTKSQQDKEAQEAEGKAEINAAANSGLNDITNAVGQGAGVGAAGIGAGLNIGGAIIENKTDDNSVYTNTKKERTGNILGEAAKGAGKGVAIGATIGTAVPVVGNVVGGVVGGIVGAGLGALKGNKENKQAAKDSEEALAEQSKLAGAYNSAYLNSRLTGANAGFGYNSSTNMGTQFTSNYFQAKFGGAKPLPGGKAVPIGDGAVKFVGQTHEEGGIMVDPKTEVEHNETSTKVLGREYFFSDHLKLNGKSFAKRHEAIEKSNATPEAKKAAIEKLAAVQEKKAGRAPAGIHKYGGVHVYLTGGETETDPPKKESVNTNNTDFKVKAQTETGLSYSPVGNAGEDEYWKDDTTYETKWKPFVAESLKTDEQVKATAERLAKVGKTPKEQAEIDRRIAAANGDMGKLRTILQTEGTDGQIGPFHRALRESFAPVTPPTPPGEPEVKDEKAAETPAAPTVPLDPKHQDCGPGTYRNEAGECVTVPDLPADKTSSTVAVGLAQLIPPAVALASKYKTAKGIGVVPGVAGVKGAVLPRVNLNKERSETVNSTVAVTNAIRSQNSGPGSIAAMMAANKNMNQNTLKIAETEARANKELAGNEAELGMKASMFNASQEADRQKTNADIKKFNKELEVGEKRYRREEILGSIDTAVSKVAGIVKDERMYKATERLAKALDQTKSYERFEVYEKLAKEKKRKGSPFSGLTDFELRKISAAIVGKQEGVVAKPEEKSEGKPTETNKKKLGGVKKYVSRLGDLKYNTVKV